MHNLFIKYLDIQKLTDTQFKQLIEVSWFTDKLMLSELKQYVSHKNHLCKLSTVDQLLMRLICGLNIVLYFTQR